MLLRANAWRLGPACPPLLSRGASGGGRPHRPRAPSAPGQHLLADRAVLSRLVAAAQLRPGDYVLEVGPGDGRLTLAILDAVGPSGRVTCVELGADMRRRLRASLGAHAGRVTILEGSAVDPSLDLGLGAVDAVVANLPYSISTPFCKRLAMASCPSAPEGAPPRWRTAVLLVQEEFAHKAAALPAGRGETTAGSEGSAGLGGGSDENGDEGGRTGPEPKPRDVPGNHKTKTKKKSGSNTHGGGGVTRGGSSHPYVELLAAHAGLTVSSLCIAHKLRSAVHRTHLALTHKSARCC